MSLTRRRRPSGAGARVRRDVLVFVLVAVVTLAAVSVGAVFYARQAAQAEAFQDAEHTTRRIGEGVVAPLLPDVLAGDRTQRAKLDEAVANRLRDGLFSELIVWRGDGTVLYASDPALIGRVEPVPAEATAAIERGQVSSSIDRHSMTAPGGTGTGRSVEVYVPLRLPGQPPLAFEAYYGAERLDRHTAVLAARLVPLAVGALVLLQVVQIPITVSLARRVRRHEAHRSYLLETTLSASDRERRQIAADLNDGVVQDLAGAGYAIDALLREVPEHRRPVLDAVGSAVRVSLEQLQRLMIDIYPPDLSRAGLAGAVRDLAERLRDHGVTPTVRIEPLPELDDAVAAALYRVAREVIANVGKHACADTVTVRLGPEPVHPGDIVLTVDDDGIGVTAEGLDRRAEGHLGLRLLTDRVDALGGVFTVEPRHGGGTRAYVRVPARITVDGGEHVMAQAAATLADRREGEPAPGAARSSHRSTRDS
ncbi:sensor histidine kinase [Pseudonocardia bannensis]|uniref:Histidine kinase domain-containing protein n=1 Tax=Pseudonocardia bannensis TaxID=630973 RepID=A0A848DLJ9_9PSEU|nr:ATP-binding protein [Pseudonocardia bannensis]NMH93264.1 hypothetical protein [Pseudonocardia bannensis]